MITVHALTENRYLCSTNVHNGERISLPLHHYIYTQRVEQRTLRVVFSVALLRFVWEVQFFVDNFRYI